MVCSSSSSRRDVFVRAEDGVRISSLVRTRVQAWGVHALEYSIGGKRGGHWCYVSAKGVSGGDDDDTL